MSELWVAVNYVAAGFILYLAAFFLTDKFGLFARFKKWPRPSKAAVCESSAAPCRDVLFDSPSYLLGDRTARCPCAALCSGRISAWEEPRPRSSGVPLDIGIRIFPTSGRAYHIRIFEVDRKLIDADASIGETELINSRSHFSFDDESLTDQLARIGVALERLELPYNSDYPI
jgi:hypothetical protein